MDGGESGGRFPLRSFQGVQHALSIICCTSLYSFLISNQTMLGLDSYGSDADSDTELAPPPKPKPKKSLASLLPPAKKSTFALPPPASIGISLPAPKGAAKRRGGPVKITVEALKPTEGDEEEDGPSSKKRRLDNGGDKKVGAGSSTLLAMLPAPKKAEPITAEAPKALGVGAGGGDTGVSMESISAPPPVADDAEEDDPGLSFLPPHLRKPRTKPAPSLVKNGPSLYSAPVSAPLVPPKPAEPEVDFFSLGKPKPMKLPREKAHCCV